MPFIMMVAIVTYEKISYQGNTSVWYITYDNNFRGYLSCYFNKGTKCLIAYLANYKYVTILSIISISILTMRRLCYYLKNIYSILLALAVIIGIPMGVTYILATWLLNYNSIDYSAFNEYFYIYISITIPFKLRNKNAKATTYYYCQNPVPYKDISSYIIY